MVDSETLSTCFEKLCVEVLPSLGTDDPLLTRIISARLLIERIGEQDANYWWDSHVLNEFGQSTLGDTVPRTATRSQIDLAMKVGRKVENKTIDEGAVSLYDLGPFVEDQIQREINKINGNDGIDILKEKSIEITESGWADSLSNGELTVSPGVGTAYEIGSISIDNLQQEEALEDVLSQLIQGYGAATKQDLKIPYYSLV